MTNNLIKIKIMEEDGIPAIILPPSIEIIIRRRKKAGEKNGPVGISDLFGDYEEEYDDDY